jgi:hypothetical protein
VLLAAPDLSTDGLTSFLHRVGAAAMLGTACALGSHGSSVEIRVATICVVAVTLPLAFVIVSDRDPYGVLQKKERRDAKVERQVACSFPAAVLYFACARGLRHSFVQAEDATEFLVRIDETDAVLGTGYASSFAPLDAAGYACTCAACLVLVMSGASKASAFSVGVAVSVQCLSAVNASMCTTRTGRW